MAEQAAPESARSDRMRLVFINRFYAPDLSATSQILTDVAEMLVASGYQVTVFTSGISYDGRERFRNRETINDVDVRRIWTTRFGRSSTLGRAIDYLTFYVSAFFVLFFQASRRDLLIVKTDPPMLSIPVGIITRIKHLKTVNWLQDVFPEVAEELSDSAGNNPLIGMLKFLRNRSLRRAAANICIGKKMAEKVETFGVQKGQIHVIENFADDHAIRDRTDYSPELRSNWGISQSDFIIGYSGNLGRAHDLDTILGAASRLRDHQHIKFLFIGGGHLRDRLANAINEGNLDNILLKPYQPREKLPESLGLPNVHWASLNPDLEGLIVPSKAYGIAAAGRPLLMIGDLSGEIGAKVVQHGFGSCFRPGDIEAVSEYILHLSQSPTLLTELNENARVYLEQHASKKHAFANWRKLIEHLHSAD
ncbi:MAG: glycosyltransferase family 4 protein [Pseudomonadota bacterium]